MKILHVYKTYFPDTFGGLERAIEQICRETSKFQVVNSILTLSSNPTPALIRRPEATVIRERAWLEVGSSPFNFGLVRRYKRIAEQYDLLHYHFPWPFADVLHLAGGGSRPAIVTYHSDIVRQKLLKIVYRPVMRRFLSTMDSIVATSPNYLESSDDLKPFRPKCELIPYGLDERYYPTLDVSRRERWRAVVAEDFFLFIGVLRYYKGLDFLLDAVSGTSHRVVIVGTGPMERHLRRRIEKECMSNVVLLGYVDDADKLTLLSLCKALVFSSHLRSEAFGISLLEGLMVGKPLISAEVGTGTSYVNENGVTGFVVKPADGSALREAMNKLASDPALANKMGAAARARFERLFQADRMGRLYFDVYRRVLEIGNHGDS